jgi:hypothetical protein
LRSTTLAGTVHAALLDAVRSATSHNRSDGVAPAAVLWTDKERHWEAVIPHLTGELQLLTLGPYAPDALMGPAIWIRCVIAGTLSKVELLYGGLMAVGGLNLGGGLDPVYNAVNVAEFAVEKGAIALLIPVSARRQLNDLSDEMATKLTVLYYSDSREALIKALGDY